MVDSPVARAVLGALAEGWPADADFARVVIETRGPDWLVVTVWTSTPGPVIGRRGATASAIRDRLRAAVPGRSLELVVRDAGGPDPRGTSDEEAGSP